MDVLEAEGVEHVYGLPGGHVLSIYDALHDSDAIRHVLVRHEHAAASMAAAHAQLTGEPGVCLVTAGPGATNLLTGIAEAYVGSLPVVVLAGRGATVSAHRGAAQEVATDQVFAPVTKWSVRVDRPDLVAGVLRQAFATARSGRPGPVVVDLPRDVLDAEVEASPTSRSALPHAPPGDARVVAAAAEALAAARRPIVVAGGGAMASGAAEPLRILAQRFVLPVLTTLAGRGCIPDDHPLSVGGLGAHRNRLSKRLLGEADVVLGLGCRFEEMESNWSPSAVPRPDATYIQVDIHAPEIGRGVPAQLGIVGDVRAVLEQLLAALEGHPAMLAADAYASHPRTLAAAAELAAIEATPPSSRLPASRCIPCARSSRPARRCRATRSSASTWAPARSTSPAPTPFFEGLRAALDDRALELLRDGLRGRRRCPRRGSCTPSARRSPSWATAPSRWCSTSCRSRPSIDSAVTWCVFDDGALGSIRDIQQYRFAGRILGTQFDAGARLRRHRPRVRLPRRARRRPDEVERGAAAARSPPRPRRAGRRRLRRLARAHARHARALLLLSGRAGRTHRPRVGE